jgi:hypothetical protein
METPNPLTKLLKILKEVFEEKRTFSHVTNQAQCIEESNIIILITYLCANNLFVRAEKGDNLLFSN